MWDYLRRTPCRRGILEHIAPVQGQEMVRTYARCRNRAIRNEIRARKNTTPRPCFSRRLMTTLCPRILFSERITASKSLRIFCLANKRLYEHMKMVDLCYIRTEPAEKRKHPNSKRVGYITSCTTCVHKSTGSSIRQSFWYLERVESDGCQDKR